MTIPQEVTDAAVKAVLDVLYPVHEDLGGDRIAIFEWGHETTPTAEEMEELAREVAARVIPAVLSAL